MISSIVLMIGSKFVLPNYLAGPHEQARRARTGTAGTNGHGGHEQARRARTGTEGTNGHGGHERARRAACGSTGHELAGHTLGHHTAKLLA